MKRVEEASAADEILLPSIITDGVKDIVHAALDAVPLVPSDDVALVPYAAPADTPPYTETQSTTVYRPHHQHHRRPHHAARPVMDAPKLFQYQLGVAAGVLTLPQ